MHLAGCYICFQILSAAPPRGEVATLSHQLRCYPQRHKLLKYITAQYTEFKPWNSIGTRNVQWGGCVCFNLATKQCEVLVLKTRLHLPFSSFGLQSMSQNSRIEPLKNPWDTPPQNHLKNIKNKVCLMLATLEVLKQVVGTSHLLFHTRCGTILKGSSVRKLKCSELWSSNWFKLGTIKIWSLSTSKPTQFLDPL